MADEVRLIGIAAAGRMCRLSRSRAYALAQSGELPEALRLAGAWRVNVAVLNEWLDRAAAHPVAPRQPRDQAVREQAAPEVETGTASDDLWRDRATGLGRVVAS